MRFNGPTDEWDGGWRDEVVGFPKIFLFFYFFIFCVVVPLLDWVDVAGCDVLLLFLVHHFFHCFVVPNSCYILSL
jgi:hypothetical protein